MSNDLSYKRSEIKPPYAPLLQKPSLCAAACLQMILYRRGFGLYDQEEMAEILDIPVHISRAGAFSRNLRTVEDPYELFHTVESEVSINKFLGYKKLPLIARAYKASKIGDVARFAASQLDNRNDVWVELHLDEVTGNPMIHDNVVQSVEFYRTGDFLVTLNPSPTSKQTHRYESKVLRRAIGTEYGRECGFVVVSGVRK